MATFRKKEKKEAWDLEGVPSVRYEKVEGDTDFQYDISEDGVKESTNLSSLFQSLFPFPSSSGSQNKRAI